MSQISYIKNLRHCSLDSIMFKMCMQNFKLVAYIMREISTLKKIKVIKLHLTPNQPCLSLRMDKGYQGILRCTHRLLLNVLLMLLSYMYQI